MDAITESAPRSASIAQTAIIHPNVQLGRNVIVDEYCIVGYPPQGKHSGQLPTIIGDGTTIRSHSIIYAGTCIGEKCHLAHSVTIREHSTIGDRSSMGMYVLIEHHCTIGRGVRVQAQSGIAEYTVIEDEVWIGPRVVTANVFHPTCERAKECLAGPVIRRGAIIGAQCVIAPNVEIGAGAFVGAGSVVVRSVDERTTVFGMPARRTGKVEQMTCPYDLVEGSPYDKSLPSRPRSVPLMDLSAQYQALKQEIRLAIDSVILNNRFINGKEVTEFEAEFAKFCRVSHVLGVSNGTTAVEIILRALDIGPGDEVITSPHTFIATAEAIILTGATPVFVDVNEEGGLLDPRHLPAAITPRTKAIMPVHLYGQLAPMEQICAIARERGIYVIEDAAQAQGAALQGKRAGEWGHAASFSFYPGKNLGAFGDAGAIATNDPAIAERVGLLRDHGRTAKYISAVIGTNARLDTLQAAVLKVKLKNLEKWNQGRREIARQYRQVLEGVPIQVPAEHPGRDDIYYVFVIRTPKRDALRDFLNASGISTGIYYPVPLHLQPALRHLGYREGSFPVAERWANEGLAIPMYPELSRDALDYVAGKIRAFCTNQS